MVRTTLTALAVLVIGALAACGSSTTGGSPTPTGTSTATAPPTTVPTAVPTATPTATQAPPAEDLSGTWSGEYTGPFNGTFTLVWTQTGNALNGTIKLSSPADNLDISGNLTGSTISFGAVGVVTYTGTVASSTAMSGSYTDLANGQTGSWNATKN